MRSGVLVAVVACAAACSHSPYPCTQSAQCVIGTMQGTCEPEGFCAFPDTSCPSGERFEHGAGNGLGGQCVGATPTCGAIGAACCASASPCVSNGFCDSGTCKQCAIDVAVGANHTCVVKYDGTVWCTGNNSHGQLGNGTVGGAPVNTWGEVRDKSMAAIQDATAIAAGDEHNCVLRTGGAVSCWGHDDDGQLGDGTAGTDKPGAVAVTRLSDSSTYAGGMAVFASDDSSCALDGGGTLSCWGQNSSGQLGDGTITPRSRAVNVLAAAGGAPFGNVADVSMGAGDHACLRTTANAIYCWGFNDDGQIGNGNASSTVFVEIPTHVFDGTAVAAGRHHTCAVAGDGTVECWGDTVQGRLGRGPEMISPGTLQETPMPVLASDGGLPFGGMVSVAAGAVSCAIATNGDLYCWGMSPHGQTGTGLGAYFPTQVMRPDGSTVHGVKRVVANHAHVCALLVDGELLCWGRNFEGELGDGTFTNRAYAAPAGPSCP